MKDNPTKQFEQKLRVTLDESVDAIDPQIQYQLQLARAKVLNNEVKLFPWYKRWYTWASITGAASVCVLGFFLLSSVTLLDPSGTELTSSLDGNVFDEENGIELYEEYDFYVWLSQQDANT